MKWKEWEVGKRHLIPFGKITVVKTLVIPKIVHQLITLPDPTHWSCYKELIRNFFCLKRKSCLNEWSCVLWVISRWRNMLSLNSCIATLKISKWRHNKSYSHNLTRLMSIISPELMKTIVSCSEYVNVIMKTIKTILETL